MPVSCVCLLCKQTFATKLSRIRKGRGKYCSQQCYHEQRRQRLRPQMRHKRQRPTLADHFWSFVLKTEGCWLWQGGKTPKGYGVFHPRGPRSTKAFRAHRFAYEITYGLILPGLNCLHHCDTPPCVRPDHLFLGTDSDNSRDMVGKGRAGSSLHPRKLARGEHHPHARLTESHVRTIRRVHEREQWSQKRLATCFDISQSAISLILRHKSWRHVL